MMKSNLARRGMSTSWLSLPVQMEMEKAISQ
jgi:hypothetical protein